MPTKRGSSRFTDTQVRDLRARNHAAPLGIDVRAAAREFGVAPETIRKLLRGDTFANLGGGDEPERNPHQYQSHEVIPLTPEQEEDMQAGMRRMAAKYAIPIIPNADTLVRELKAILPTPTTQTPILSSADLRKLLANPREFIPEAFAAKADDTEAPDVPDAGYED